MPADDAATYDAEPAFTPPDAATGDAPYDLSHVPESMGWADWSVPPEVWAAVAIACGLMLAGLLVWLLLVTPGRRLRRKAARYGLALPFGRAVRLGWAAAESERLLGLWVRLRQSSVTDIGFDELEAHHRAGGRVADVVEALIHARRCGVRFDWPALCRIDLAGQNPSPIVDRAVKPWRIDVPGELLGGGPLLAISGDGVELAITGVAELVTEPDEHHPLPRAAAMVANIAKLIVAYVHACRSHRTLLREPTRLADAVNAAELPAGAALRLLRFTVTRIERGPGAPADPAEARDRIRRLLDAHPAQRMTADELAALAPACVQLADHELARRACLLALEREPNHERANMWLHETLHHADAPLDEQLAHAAACVERGVEPRTCWRLLHASILCRMATATDPATGDARVVQPALYRRAADELRQLSASNDRLVSHAHAAGWIDDWSHAFPGLDDQLAQLGVGDNPLSP